MRLIDDNAVARMMLRIESGEDLIPTLEALAYAEGWGEAYVTGSGVLDLADVQKPTAAEALTLDSAQLLSLSGRVRRTDSRCVATLYASVLSGNTVHHGQITAAVTGELLLVVDAMSGTNAVATRKPTSIAPTTQASPATVASSAPPPPSAAAPSAAAPSAAAPSAAAPSAAAPSAAAPSAAAPSSAAPSSAAAPPPAHAKPSPPSLLDGQRSATKPLSQSFTTKPVLRRIPSAPQVADDEVYEDEIEPGDVLNHPQLGRCEVVGDDGSGGTRIRVPSGRIRTLKLDALRIMRTDASGGDDGPRIYKVAGPRRR